MRWNQYFGIPAVIKLDLEGAFRGLQLRDWCGTRGVRLEHAPAEFHQSIGDVERQIGFLRHKIEVFLRHEPHDPSMVAAAMVGVHNTLARARHHCGRGWWPEAPPHPPRTHRIFGTPRTPRTPACTPRTHDAQCILTGAENMLSSSRDSRASLLD